MLGVCLDYQDTFDLILVKVMYFFFEVYLVNVKPSLRFGRNSIVPDA